MSGQIRNTDQIPSDLTQDNQWDAARGAARAQNCSRADVSTRRKAYLIDIDNFIYEVRRQSRLMLQKWTVR